MTGMRLKLCTIASLLLISLALASMSLVGLAVAAPDSGEPDQLTTGKIIIGTADSKDEKQANPNIKYKASLGSKWSSGWKKQGKTAGSEKKKPQLIRMKVAKDGLKGDVKYRVFVKSKGWRPWISSGKAAGVKGWHMRGLQVKLTGELGSQFDIVYRVSLDGLGWQPWVVNGTLAGSKGSLGQIERFQAKLVRKGSEQRIPDGAYFVSLARNANASMNLPDSTNSKNLQVTKASFSASKTNLRFYVRNQNDGTVLLQSCASGLYLCERSGKVVQRPDSGGAASRWRISEWRGGHTLVNASSGNSIKLVKGKAITASKGSRWSLTRTDVLADGTYNIVSQSLGMLLAVSGKSTKNGAALIVQEQEETNAEVFKLERTARDTYRMTNAGSKKRIEVKGGSIAQNAVVRQSAPASGALQKWKLIYLSNGSFRLVNKASKNSLTVQGDGDDGSSVYSCTYTGTNVQSWTFSPQKAYRLGPEARAAKFAATQSSATNYFIAVDLTNHWVCIFRGSKGNRTLLKSWQCSTGAPGTPTPSGEYTTGYKQYSFGSGYTVYYATGFIGSVYLFHSIKFNEGTFIVKDGRLGQSVSEGCIRLALGNAKWIYNNIPSGTKVKIYY